MDHVPDDPSTKEGAPRRPTTRDPERTPRSAIGARQTGTDRRASKKIGAKKGTTRKRAAKQTAAKKGTTRKRAAKKTTADTRRESKPGAADAATPARSPRRSKSAEPQSRTTGTRVERIACLSDAHGNRHALEAAIGHARQHGATRFVFSGDLIVKGPDPHGCVETLQALDPWVAIRGNNERAVLELYAARRAGTKAAKEADARVKKKFPWTLDRLGEDDVRYLARLPSEARVTLAGSDLHVVHGTPLSDTEYTYPSLTERSLARFYDGGPRPDVLVAGHSHVPFVKDVDGTLVVNAGSVGLPYDTDPRGAYAFIELTPGQPPQAKVVRFDYPHEPVADAVAQDDVPGTHPMLYHHGRKDVTANPRRLTVIELAQRHLARQLDKAQVHAEGITTREDPEDVHQLRVALRRARSTLRLLGQAWSDDIVTQVQACLRTTMKQAGEVRDLDVLRARFVGALEKTDVEGRAVGAFLAWLEEPRVRHLEGLRAHLADEEWQLCLGRWDALVTAGVDDPIFAFQRAQDAARVAIGRAAADVKKAWCAPLEEAKDAKLHRLRIETKRLRYVSECFQPAYPETLPDAIATLKQYQTELGDHQDAATARAFLKRLRKQHDDMDPAVQDVVQRLRDLEKQVPADSRSGLGAFARENGKPWKPVKKAVGA